MKKVKKYKIIALAGMAGAGKDTLLKEYLKSPSINCREIISFTSRPPREKEVDGVNYHFVTKDQFYNMIDNNGFLEYTTFRGWLYGTGKQALSTEKWNIGVFNPAGVRMLRHSSEVEVVVIYIGASRKERLIRQLQREDKPDVDEIIRRYATDEEDFKDFVPDYSITNVDIAESVKTLKKIVSKIGQS